MKENQPKGFVERTGEKAMGAGAIAVPLSLIINAGLFEFGFFLLIAGAGAKSLGKRINKNG